MRSFLRRLIQALLLWCSASQAQSQIDTPTCVPGEVGGVPTAESLGIGPEGGFYWIACPDGKLFVTVWLWSDVSLSNLGSRLETVRSAVDPKAAALASWKRNVRVDWNDPKYDSVHAAARSDIAFYKRDPDAWAK